MYPSGMLLTVVGHVVPVVSVLQPSSRTALGRRKQPMAPIRQASPSSFAYLFRIAYPPCNVIYRYL